MADLATFWDGPVTWLERLCLRSLADRGHALKLFALNPGALRGADLPAEVLDVRDVLPDSHPAYVYKQRPAGLRVFSDIARLAMLRSGAGTWLDADCLMLTDLPADQTIMGWVRPGKINNAVLLLPRASDILRDYYDSLSAIPLRAPWAKFRRRMAREAEIVFGSRASPDMPGRLSLGPTALTYFVKKYRLDSCAMPPVVFYPVIEAEALCLVDRDDRIARSRLTAQTRIVHVWQSRLRDVGALAEPPPPTSFLGQALRRHGL